MAHLLFFIFLGFFLGAFGTLVGTGGGFILVPVLLWLYPNESPIFITSISLAVVSVNSLSGVVAYRRMKRVDFLSGGIFSAATVPGAILGASSTVFVPRGMFDALIGGVLLVACILLLSRPAGKRASSDLSCTPAANAAAISRRKRIIGATLSFFIGFFSSMVGISGGIFQVPMMVYGLGFPVHIAVATSEFILALKGLAASSVHFFSGAMFAGIKQIIVLSIGVAFGAQAGAWLSSHVQSVWIMRVLALSIGTIGVQFLISGLAIL